MTNVYGPLFFVYSAGFSKLGTASKTVAHTDALLPGEFSISKGLKLVGHLVLCVDLYACVSIDANISLDIDIGIDTDYIAMCI